MWTPMPIQIMHSRPWLALAVAVGLVLSAQGAPNGALPAAPLNIGYYEV